MDCKKNDLISRKDLCEMIAKLENDVRKLIVRMPKGTPEYERCYSRLNELNEFKSEVKAIESVEAVPVVRCKDCRYWDRETGWCEEHSHFWNGNNDFCHPWESSDWKSFNENDFCSAGEKKEN